MRIKLTYDMNVILWIYFAYEWSENSIEVFKLIFKLIHDINVILWIYDQRIQFKYLNNFKYLN